MANLEHLKSKWPSSIVARKKVAEFSGGILSEKYLANLDSLGQGPERLHIGRQVAYPVDSLIRWMEERAS
jgi:hypothetical protein